MLYCMLVACVFLSERESAIIMFVNYRRRHTLERIDYKLSVLLITRFERVAPAKPGLTRAISCTCLPVSLNLVAALLRVVGITAGLAESNGSLPSGLWLTSPTGWLPRTLIRSGTLHSAIEYGLPLPLHGIRMSVGYLQCQSLSQQARSEKRSRQHFDVSLCPLMRQCITRLNFTTKMVAKTE